MKKRECVYVIGAGFSAGLGYPLTSDLLVRLWERLNDDLKKQLEPVIRFHHPGFDPTRFSTFPNIEELLSEVQVNEELFDASRQYEGHFTKIKLQDVQTNLLMKIAAWFHDISKCVKPAAPKVAWLKQFRERVISENGAIVSFNWDLILDELIFKDDIGSECYGFSETSHAVPLLLKPHGSLNWFEGKLGEKLKDIKRTKIFDHGGSDKVYAFLEFRAPVSKKGQTYTPLIVPPVYLKKFGKPVFKTLWQKSTAVLSSAKRVVFLGYSMPRADLHAQFIMRCGFNNQVKGEIDKGGRRKKATGPAEIIIVNPDWEAARRVETAVGPEHTCKWVSSPVSEWVKQGGGA